MFSIAVIGAGQLGSRHLQSLSGVDHPLRIYVADPNPSSLQTAKERFEETSTKQPREISYHTSLNELPGKLHIAIVASNSNVRKTIVTSLLKSCKVDCLILEKFLFQQSSDYAAVDELLAQTGTRAWVNCPRRAAQFYREIAGMITGNVQFAVTGSNWGLGCNTIHFLDLFSLLTGDGEIHMISEDIDNLLIESKRAGYVEFSGSIQLTTGRGDYFQAISLANGNHPIMMKISTAENEWVINETNKYALRFSADNNWEPERHSFQLPFQSQAGAMVISDLLSSGQCQLTPYHTSMKLHLAFLKGLLQKYNKITNNIINEICPIT